MTDEIQSTGTQWMRFPVFAGITGGVLLLIVLNLANCVWYELLEYNRGVFGHYRYSYIALVLLGFVFTGALSVLPTAEQGIARKKVLASGILSGIIAGFVFSSLFLYTNILPNPSGYPQYPGDYLKLATLFHGIVSGWFILMGISVITGMIVATMSARAFDFIRQCRFKNSVSRESEWKCGMMYRMTLVALLTLIAAIAVLPPAIIAAGIEGDAVAQEPPVRIDPVFTNRSAPPVQPVSGGNTANVSRWMQQHAGQEVSVGEYLEIIHPGYLDTRPQNVQEAYYQMMIRVPDMHLMNVSTQSGERSVAVAMAGQPEIPEDKHTAYPENDTAKRIQNTSMIPVLDGLAVRAISMGTASSYSFLEKNHSLVI